jgi:hypothetical protein
MKQDPNMADSPRDFQASFQEFLKQMAEKTQAEDPPFVARLRRHFGQDPVGLAVLSEDFPDRDHPNVQVALDSWLGKEGRSVDLVGVVCDQPFFAVTLSSLATPVRSRREAPHEGPVPYANAVLDAGRVIPCIQSGLLLLNDLEERLAVLVQGPRRESPFARVTVEVMAHDRQRAESFLAELRRTMRTRSVYRGRVVSLKQDRRGNVQVEFHRLAKVPREGIILPGKLLDRIELQTIRFSEHSKALLEQGRHLKRGILLHGPPGTGKTLTAMYLAEAMHGRTVILLTGRGLGAIQQSCAFARALEPAIVILEDVDLVAEERTMRESGCTSPLLFELLNEMDGLSDDADILFLLTTNRPALLEPALAARPGRIDQAFEVPLPDESCRTRLFELYARGLKLGVESFDAFVKRTEGASAAFIRELLRKAALFAADDGSDGRVEDRHIDGALRELVVEGGELTRSLLGYRRDA